MPIDSQDAPAAPFKEFIEEAVAIQKEDAPAEEKDPAVAAAEDSLKRMLDGFNNLFRVWEDAHGMGANIGFHYDPATGRKKLVVLDVAPRVTEKPSDEAVKAAGEVLEQAQPEELKAAPGGEVSSG